jgi:acyl-CoA thioesterase I
MRKLFPTLLLLFFGWTILKCSIQKKEETRNTKKDQTIKYLALGDSYTIGQSVCDTCGFPMQLQNAILNSLPNQTKMVTDRIAKTGWTTTQLIQAITEENPTADYDIVTLLIGVNNQYQNKPFQVYEQEFPKLVALATQKAKGMKKNVLVLSIPDYAFTPFGNRSKTISKEIDQYNTFASNYCKNNSISYVTITDLTRLGLEQPNLVASDGLHPSTIAYTKITNRILPIIKEKLGL